MTKPNIFEFATKELSQDAVICWLAAWADPKTSSINTELHHIGRQFLNTLLAPFDHRMPERIDSLTVEQQVNGIDILIVVNEVLAICVEDKAGSTEHSNQLSRYLDYLSSNFEREKIFPVYIQTGEQADYKDVLDTGYSVIKRK